MNAERGICWDTMLPCQEVLQSEFAEERLWKRDARAPIVILVDARGSPARLAAVLVDGDAMEWCDFAPPAELMRRARH